MSVIKYTEILGDYERIYEGELADVEALLAWFAARADSETGA